MRSEPDLDGLKICLLAGTLGQGGAERQLFYIAQALLGAGAHPRVLCLTQGEHWEARIQNLGIPVVWVGKNPSRVARLSSVCRELRRDPPHIVQSQHFYTNLYAVGAARLLGLHEVGAIRSNVASEVKNNGHLLGRLSLQLPRTLAANSAAAIQAAIGQGIAPGRLHLLANVVDTERFRPQPRSSGEVRILSVGRMTREKRYDRLLEIAASARRQSKRQIRMILAGDGPLRPQLEAQAAQLGLFPDGVEFRGSQEDIAPLYRDADLFLLTSDYEGSPNVVLEAMASGLPVVATRVGGVPELVQDGVTGYMADPQATSRLAEALLELAEDEAKRREFGARARAFVEQRHAPAGLPAALKRIYAAALS